MMDSCGRQCEGAAGEGGGPPGPAHQRVVQVSAARMDGDTGRLVDDEPLIVFYHNVHGVGGNRGLDTPQLGARVRWLRAAASPRAWGPHTR